MSHPVPGWAATPRVRVQHEMVDKLHSSPSGGGGGGKEGGRKKREARQERDSSETMVCGE